MVREEGLKQVEVRKQLPKVKEKYTEETAITVSYTKVYKSPYDAIIDNADSVAPNINTSYDLQPLDSVEALFSLKDDSGRVAILNSASYTSPAEGYLERNLCNYSNLYDVLNGFYDYYSWNKEHLNNNFYLDRALYSPRIVFELNDIVKFADVISLATPNVLKINQEKVRDLSEVNYKTLKERVRFLQNILILHKVDTVILCNWGCTDFGQNPKEICRLLIENIKVPKVVFGIPNRTNETGSNNYEVFKHIFNELGI